MKKIITLCSLVIIQLPAIAQPSIQWQKSYGGTDEDEAYSIRQTADGGYIVAGLTYSNDSDVTGNHGSGDYWVVKLDSTGTMQWQKSLGDSLMNWAYAVEQTTDSAYIIAGYNTCNSGDVTGNNGGLDYWVVKLDVSGNFIWQKSLGGSLEDWAYSIDKTADGGYIVAGQSASNDSNVTGNHGLDDYWIVKLDYSGNIQWQKSLGGSGSDIAQYIRQTSDGGYIVTGISNSTNGDVTGNHGGKDYWVVKLDSSGSIQWQKSLGGTNNDWAYAIEQTTDSGYIVAGYTWSNDGDVSGSHGYYDYWLVKLDSSGNIQWQKALGGSDGDIATSVHQTVDGGYIAAGRSRSIDGDVTGNHGTFDNWIVKLDNSGNMQWEKSLGGSATDGASSVRQTNDGGYIIAGFSQSDDGDVTGNNGAGDFWIVKLSAVTGIENTTENNLISVYPNPTKEKIILNINTKAKADVSIYDVVGKEVFCKKNISLNHYEINISDFYKGVYFLKIKERETIFTKKLIKL